MPSVQNPIALAALNRALNAVRNGPAPRPKYDSRTADKFNIRGYQELFDELAGIGRHQGRSMNSEAVAGILDALGGRVRSVAMLNILKANLGEEVSARVLAELPDFDLELCKTRSNCVLRFPPHVRETIRDGVANVTMDATTMNQWMLDALVQWVQVQRQQYALLTAAIAMNQKVLGTR
ncbi:Arc family DNA-binding protein [Pseudomonas sp. LS-2]|uniref:Arc family DNA-binding protein n=1 Tax=Pseudomonas sp. LS-2 TaxID=2315859 RepID=UPI000E70F93A|nr:Arc family DNA-binding protein [Pseudomonas sp. LS-2]RJX72592.1 Arc family DNA-binding protein [Pseudomonas sp. LS-2]